MKPNNRFARLLSACLMATMAYPVLARSEEVHLICTGTVSGTNTVKSGESVNQYTGFKDNHYVQIPFQEDMVREIRFDVESNEFWYKGWRGGFSTKGSVDGWIPAKKVSTKDSAIEATFALKKTAMLNFPPETKVTGTLDRYTGLWRISNATLQCKKFEASGKLF